MPEMLKELRPRWKEPRSELERSRLSSLELNLLGMRMEVVMIGIEEKEIIETEDLQVGEILLQDTAKENLPEIVIDTPEIEIRQEIEIILQADIQVEKRQSQHQQLIRSELSTLRSLIVLSLLIRLLPSPRI